ncbi:hypothetical protein HYPGJ_10501 [Hyphomicrobium sp. GJ21]|nr:hypothetical protein HYPGJ_10501 [Hyphomicrobium sp. GJ21]
MIRLAQVYGAVAASRASVGANRYRGLEPRILERKMSPDSCAVSRANHRPSRLVQPTEVSARG